MSYPGMDQLSSANLQLTARLITRRREAIGSLWRKLDPGRQALLALAYLRRHDSLAALARWFGIGTTTAWRYVREVIALLEALAPSLKAGLWNATSRGLRWALLDGACCEIDRVKDRRDPSKPWSEHVDRHWCRKHRHHAVTLPALTDGEGNLLWIGTGYPGSTHDLTAARADQVCYWASAADPELFADKAYTGAGPGVTVPVKGTWDNLTEEQRRHNRVVNSTRGPVERGFAQLKTWAIFRRSRCCPTLIGPAARAVLALMINDRQ